MRIVSAIGIILLLLASSTIGSFAAFEHYYRDRVYPHVSVNNVSFGGQTADEVKQYWLNQNVPFDRAVMEFRYDNQIATVSGTDLSLGYDATLSATQAYLVGRSGHFLSDLMQKFFRRSVELSPYFRWKSDVVDSALANLSEDIDIPVQDALFQFTNGRVVAFRPSSNGRRVNREEAKRRFEAAIKTLPYAPTLNIVINLPVEDVHPAVTTDKANSFGIKELIGRGYSEFQGSIPGRIHNVLLAASRLNGVLVAPGDTLSFNDAVGDISAATGYQSAYIIKDGHTVLGDGGGVCQVSSTLFRAALNAGLPIVERHAHAYRVHYYEEGGFKPGMDATVFGPTVDLKIKNDTPSYMLIQTKPDANKLTLTFEIYGTKDGRVSEISNQRLWDETPPPPALYQDDPTLPPGVVKQVDFSAWGAKASFAYKVTRGSETLQDETFTSIFRPWQAVYLRGVQQ
jgi:vancomycin resistance protein YoaR